MQVAPLPQTIVDIFRGKMLVVKDAEEEDGSRTGIRKEEAFDAINLDIDGYLDVYESLDAFMSPSEVEFTTERGYRTKAISRGCIERLPEVLLLQEKRVQYNSETRTASKLQVRFEFGNQLYMDHYLLENYHAYGSVLQAYHEDMAELMKVRREHGSLCAQKEAITNALSGALFYFQDEQFEHLRADAMARAPIDCVAPELIAAALQQHINSIELKAAELQDAMLNLKERAKEILEKPALTKHMFVLHAVLIHDGPTPEGGHYYAFVRDAHLKMWYRFNDHSVEAVEEATVFAEAFGGNPCCETRNAYSLIYVRERVLEPSEGGNLSEDLLHEVQEDNALFSAMLDSMETQAPVDQQTQLLFEGLTQEQPDPVNNTSHEAILQRLGTDS